MAISKTNKPHSVPLLALLLTMLLMLLKRVHSADSLSFTFNKFSPNQEDLILQGDASIGSGENVLQLTKFDDSGRPAHDSVGRVLYYAPVHLWKSSGQLVSSFETTFTFSISSPDPDPADGIAFFIAPPDTIPGAAGRYLGLFPQITSLKNSSSSYSHHKKVKTNIGAKDATNPVVAVEFDTYPNTDIGDPEQKHIGIDINSITSVTTTGWDWQNGATAKAHIRYDSASQRLTVVASYPNTSPVTLYYDIDLSTILPEWVRVGFSAATGALVEANTLLSWSFTSTLHTNKIQNKDMYSVAM